MGFMAFMTFTAMCVLCVPVCACQCVPVRASRDRADGPRLPGRAPRLGVGHGGLGSSAGFQELGTELKFISTGLPRHGCRAFRF